MFRKVLQRFRYRSRPLLPSFFRTMKHRGGKDQETVPKVLETSLCKGAPSKGFYHGSVLADTCHHEDSDMVLTSANRFLTSDGLPSVSRDSKGRVRWYCVLHSLDSAGSTASPEIQFHDQLGAQHSW